MKWNEFGTVTVKKNTTVLIVRARFNEAVTAGLLAGAHKALAECGIAQKNIREIVVPGSYDIPYGIIAGTKKKKPHAVIVLGAIIKGETKHDEYIANATFGTVHTLQTALNIPIGLGIITTNTKEQAEARSADSAGNVGYQAAYAAAELLAL